jgi:sulfur-oxidizing protein SoxX
MKTKKGIPLAVGFAACAAVTFTTAYAFGGGKDDYTKMSANEMAEYLIFQTDSFDLEQEVHEGGTAKSRMTQDGLQKACTVTGNGKPGSDTLAAVSADARSAIKYPKNGITLGDWKKGADLAWSGFGFRVGNEKDDHSSRETGGNCYNCHELTSDRTGGTLGSDLRGYGKKRGNSEGMIKFAYDTIYNPHATFACTDMPRFGHKGILSEEQISHLLAYLFDPKSPVNQ